MTAPHRPPDQNSAAARGVVLLVVAVVIGAFFLARGNTGSVLGDQGGASAASTTTTSAPTPNTTPATTPTTSKPATATKIAIYNGTGGKAPSAAGNSRTKLVSVGYATSNISINDTGQLPTTAIYYEPTVTRTDAGAVAFALGFPATTIGPAQAAPTAIPASAKGADVVVLIGLDEQTNPTVSARSTASSTTSSSSTTSTTTG